MPSLPYRRLVVGALAVSLVPVGSAFAGGTVKVTMDEFSLKASPKSISSGRVTFNSRNASRPATAITSNCRSQPAIHIAAFGVEG